MKPKFLFLLLLSAGLWVQGTAHGAGTILINGKVITGDARGTIAEALAIEGNQIAAVGTNRSIRGRAKSDSRVIDLGGRTVIPGLIDSHIHAIRGALTFGRELRWTDAKSLKDALGMIRAAAETVPKGEWINVVGGWHASQFPENRLPTPEELTRIAPDHPVYVQHLYSEAILNRAALRALNLKEDKQVPPRGKLERGPDGGPTGRITGNVPTFATLYGKLPQPSLEDRKAGTRAFFRELNRLGMTGIVDAGGGGMFWKKHYDAVLGVWKDGDLSLRVRFRLMPQPPHRGKELSIFKAWSRDVRGGFGDEWLRWTGWGEVIIWGMHDGDRAGRKFTPKPQAKAALEEALTWIAQRKENLEIHASSDGSARQILDIIEAVDRTVDVNGLRWTIAHLDDGTTGTLERMKALGMGYSVQDRLYFSGDEVLERIGQERARKAPPLKAALDLGIAIAGGTDAHRIAPYSPMRSLQWLLDGKSVSGRQIRGPEQTPTRLEALRIYTLNSAWMSFEEKERGSLETGKLADLAVLSKDYLSVPVEAIHTIESLLTMVGGKVVYAAGPFQSLGN